METKMTTRTTTTDLGKIVLTPGGEYSPDKTYEERTFVLYQNSTYVALQTVTGIEPSNDLVNWQLMAKGFAGSETQIEGYVFVDNEEVIAPAADPALDADKLGGNLPDYYAPQHEISDSFSETKSYAVGDYCIYLNALYRFTNAKAAGAWDGSAVVPVTLAQEIAANRGGIEAINNNFGLEGTVEKFVAGHSGTIPLYIKTMHSGNDFSQFTLNSKGADLGANIGGTWTTLWEVATKGDSLVDKGTITTGDDLDNYIVMGCYRYNGAPSNTPPYSDWGLLCVFRANNYTTQLAFAECRKIHTRSLVIGNSWTSWLQS